jgi:regulator of sirC expression with transglutaminase-like and TPR domain
MAVPLSFEMPSPLGYFAALVAEDDGFSLLEAAIAIAQDDHPGLDPQTVLSEIDTLADRLRRRLPADASPVHRLRLLNKYFFRELGFAGNVNDYHDVANSYLHRVLVTRRGIPITLALLYGEMANQIGLTAQGVSFPGHFLVKLKLPNGEVVIDPFTGESLSREVLDERLEPYRRQQGLVGDFEVPLGLFLQAAESRDIIARMLRNLKAIHEQAQDLPRLLAVQHRLICLLPQAWEEHRDRAMVLAEMGHMEAAKVDLDTYLRQQPDAGDATVLRTLRTTWGGPPRPQLH